MDNCSGASDGLSDELDRVPIPYTIAEHADDVLAQLLSGEPDPLEEDGDGWGQTPIERSRLRLLSRRSRPRLRLLP